MSEQLPSSLPSWRMTETLRFAGALSLPEAMTARLASLPAENPYLAVVYLRKPMTEDELRKLWTGWVDTVLLSPSASGRKPLSWDHTTICQARGFDACAGGAERKLVTQFQRWVASLSTDDQVDLAKIGLQADVLQRASAEGRIYGFVTWQTAAVLRLLSSKSELVSGIAVVGEVR
ncbi:hypothetical protein [Thermoactinospora rubra]|uniref:hypothetical protein n=1 Tax=Thermoactinospora rubra TaxID=1088767 RepID=UPI00117D1300|nr:hypothetical protein [Thermoactinospora rubra]